MFFDGTVVEAISLVKERNLKLLVTIQDNGDFCRELDETIWSDGEVMSVLKDKAVALKIVDGTPDSTNFKALFPVFIVPTVYIISASGVPEAVLLEHKIEKTNLISKLTSDGSPQNSTVPTTLTNANVPNMTTGSTSTTVAPPETAPLVPSEQMPDATNVPNMTTGSASTTLPPSETAPLVTSEQMPDATPAENKTVPLPSTELVPPRNQVPMRSDEPPPKVARTSDAVPNLTEQSSLPSASTAPAGSRDVPLSRPVQAVKGSGVTSSQKEDNKTIADAASKPSSENSTDRPALNVATSATAAARTDNPATRGPPQKASKSKKPEKEHVRPAPTVSHLSFRLPDGGKVTNSFAAEDTLLVVRQFVSNHCHGRANLACMYPRVVFTEADSLRTLSDLDLCPSATILVTRPAPGSTSQPEFSLAGFATVFHRFLNFLTWFINPSNWFPSTNQQREIELSSDGRQSSAAMPHQSSSAPRTAPPVPPSGQQRPQLMTLNDLGESGGGQGGEGPLGQLRRRFTGQQQQPPPSMGIRRQGNIAGFGNPSNDDEDQQRFWNGNSTQFGGDDKK